MPSPGVDFHAMLRHLNEATVRFVVIGGIAMNLHGADNITSDMDISFDRDRRNTEALAQMLRAHNAYPRGFPPGLPFVVDAQAFRNSTNVTLETDLGGFDLLAEPEGVDGFAGLWERAVVMEIDGRAVRVASIPDLIAMKRAADRPKDREHIMQLEALLQLQDAESD